MRIGLAQLNYILGDITGNVQKILTTLDWARQEQVDIALFSELAVVGYPPEDLLLEAGFLEKAEEGLQKIIHASQGLMVFLGTIRQAAKKEEKHLHNSVAVLCDRKLLGFYDKWLLPTYDVFDERRYFTPGTELSIWEYKGKKIAVTICEDIWQHAHLGGLSYPKDPVILLKEHKIDLLVNLSASPYEYGKKEIRWDVCAKAAKTLGCPVALCCQVGVNDQIVFDGYSIFVDEKGKKVAAAKGFIEERKIVQLQQASCIEEESSSIEDLYSALILGIKDYFHKQGLSKACIGISGGIDSALVACIAVEALGKENVFALFLPSRFTTKQSFLEAKALADRLGIVYQEISIEQPFASYQQLLSSFLLEAKTDISLQNLQTRIRSTILMTFANIFSCLLLNTANKSEMALGYCTMYGDMSGSLGVIADVVKTRVYALAEYVHQTREWISRSLIEREPSAELKENQKDADDLPPFTVLDPLIEKYIEEGKEDREIAKEMGIPLSLTQEILHKIHLAEYKRKQAPIAIRVTKKSFQAGRRFPIVQKWK